MTGGVSPAGGRSIPAAGFERTAWFFMRVSGLMLVFLALGHLVIMHLIHSIEEIDFAFVVQRYATPFWRVYDCLMLLLALLHGFNGLRVLADDYFRGGVRLAARWALGMLALMFAILGSVVIFTFQPR